MRVNPGSNPLEALNKSAPSAETEYRWATYIPSRSTGPSLKVHRLKGHAKAALSSSYPYRTEWWENGYQAFEKQGDDWVEVTDEWSKEILAKIAKENAERQRQQELRDLCSSPCRHCTVRPDAYRR